MAFTKGTPKPANSGRKPGVQNKRTQTLLEKCAQAGVDPFAMLLEFSSPFRKEGDKVIENDLNTRMAALKEVIQYVLPKRRAIEHSAHVSPELLEAAENMVNLTKEQQIELLEQQLKELKNVKN